MTPRSRFFRVAALVIGLSLHAVASRAGMSPNSAGGQNLASAPLRIADDHGGSVLAYAIRMFSLRDGRQQVQFSGACDSACTLFLALPPSQICVSRGAAFRFHDPFLVSGGDVTRVRDFMMRTYPDWVRAWIQQQGGLSTRLITMDFATASRFVPICA